MGLLTDFFEAVKDKANDYSESMSDSYGNSSERYSNMTDDQLRREIQRLKSQSGMDAKRMGKLRAMQDELERRR